MSYSTQEILESKIKRGRVFLEKLEKASLNGFEENKKLLFKLIEENKNTDYGKKYNFENIKTIEDYFKNVPFSEYEDYEEYVKRIALGEKNVLSARNTVHFATSSGSSGTPKLIPMCLEAEQLFAAYTHGMCFAVMDRELGENWVKGRGVSFTEVRFKPTESGISSGAVSGKVRYQHRETENLTYTTPICVSYPQEKMNFRYLHIRFALAEENLSFITCTFMTAAADIMQFLQENWKEIVNDIKNGTISDEFLVPEDIRKELEPIIKPMPERAEFLENEFEKGFKGIIPRIWKNMSFLFGIGGGSFKVYTEKIRYYLGNVKIHFSVYSSSEGIFAAPVESESEDMVLIPFSAFYEFRDIENDSEEIVTMDKVETGKDYEIIITNISGLYRYRIKDVVRVTGFYNTLPKIRFLYRLNQLINIAGEKTNDSCMNAVMEEFAKESGLSLTEYSVYADTASSPGRYVVFAECEGENKDRKKAAEITEKYLCRLNPSYDEKIQNGKLKNLKFYFLKKDTYEVYRELMAVKGVSPNQLKPVRIIDNPFREKFFFSMREK